MVMKWSYRVYFENICYARGIRKYLYPFENIKGASDLTLLNMYQKVRLRHSTALYSHIYAPDLPLSADRTGYIFPYSSLLPEKSVLPERKSAKYLPSHTLQSISLSGNTLPHSA